jgi:hypothetical protein
MRLFHRWFSSARATRPVRPSTRLIVEELESRLAPASFFYDVTTTGDTAGWVTGGSGTQVNPFQATTLRAAITAATLDTGNHTIEFDPSLTTSGPATITLSTVGDTTVGPSDFGIRTNITIQGPTGSNGITLDNSGSQRLFYVSATGNLTLQDLTLTGGKAIGGDGASSGILGVEGGGGAGLGGAIFNAGTLSIQNSTLTGNTAQGGMGGGLSGGNLFGGGGGGGLGGNGSTSTASGILSTPGFTGGAPNGGSGGTQGSPNGGAGGYGGGGGGGALYYSTFTYGAGGPGGFGGGGGGGSGCGSGNHGGPGGDGGFGGGGGASGAFFTIGAAGGFGGHAGDGHYAGSGAGLGGAVFNSAGSVTITSTTITGNTALSQGSNSTHRDYGGDGLGGGIFNLNGTVTAVNSTFAANTVTDGGGAPDPAAGGALYNLQLAGVNIPGSGGSATLNLTNDIFANSTGGPDFDNNGGTVATSVANLYVSGANVPGSGFTQTTTAALNLGPLQSNGGPTPTLAIDNTSSAFNAGINAGAIGSNFDQRGPGFARITFGTVDVGAYEAQSSAALSLSGSPFSENGGTATVTATLAGNVNLPVTVTLSFAGTAVNGTDYNPSATSITITAGQTSGSITLTGLANPSFVGQRTIIVSIASATNATVASPSSVTAIIEQAPTIASATATTFTVGTAGFFTVTTTGSPTPTLTESGALPAGVSFNSSTGILSGTPAAGTAGTFTLMFTASNGVTPNAAQTFTLTVNPAPVQPTMPENPTALPPTPTPLPPFVSAAFTTDGREVVELVSSSGVLTQFDATGSHQLATGVRSASVAFGTQGEIMDVVFQDGELIQFDVYGTRQLTTGVLSASVAIVSGQEVLEVVALNGTLKQYDGAGAHQLATGVRTASVAFGPAGAALGPTFGPTVGEVLDVVFADGSLFQFDFAGTHLMAKDVSTANAALTPGVQQVIDLIFADGGLWQYDATGGHNLGTV